MGARAMTRDDIIRLAREAGIVDWSLHGRLESKEEALERFAALVAAAEREACAKLCEEIAKDNDAEGADIDWVTGNMECADYIRARGESEG
jgi:hypothetical protein